MSDPVERTCRNCGHRFAGTYCNLCGEKVITPDDRSFRSFVKNLVVAFTIVDSKFVQTLWLVIRRPGKVSREYVEGRRVPYLRPLSLFFVLNLLYFLFPQVQLFSASLRTQLFYTPYGEWIKEAAVTRMVENQMDFSAYELLYDNKSTAIAKILIIVFVLIATLPLPLIYRRKDRFFTDHAALSVEMAAFNLAVNALALNLIAWILSTLFSVLGLSLGGYINEATLSIVVAATNFYFFMAASRSFYDLSGWSMVWRSLFMLGLLWISLQAYRFLLFWLTLWAV